MACSRIALRDRRGPDLVGEVATRIRRGELCVLPTETVYGLAVMPGHATAEGRARDLKGRAERQPFTWHLAAAEQTAPLVGELPMRIRRLIRRYWPGPLTVILPSATDPNGSIGMRLPAHEFTRSVIAACGTPLWLSSCNRSGQPPLLDADAILAELGAGLDLVIDDGPSPIGMASTIVRLTSPRLEVLREGILSTDEVCRTAAAQVLFVCSGNTCRSPLAEAIARDLAARKLGVPPGEVLAHGLWFASAGTAAAHGDPASDGSQAAGAEIGLDLAGHASTPLDPAMVRRADRILCMGENHRRAVLAEVPEAADKIRLLRPDGRDIGDPYGGPLTTYRRTRDELRAAIGARLDEWLQLP